ncbi:hypothetical protein Q9A_00767 [Enterococcus faecalis EnGen0066]|nr:hypothetical protein Q9A_00767 [Enterococcus faecalis EnGen0066]
MCEAVHDNHPNHSFSSILKHHHENSVPESHTNREGTRQVLLSDSAYYYLSETVALNQSLLKSAVID